MHSSSSVACGHLVHVTYLYRCCIRSYMYSSLGQCINIKYKQINNKILPANNV